MKSRIWPLFALSAFLFTLDLAVGSCSGQDSGSSMATAHRESRVETTVKLIAGMIDPGEPLHCDISWVDEDSVRYYLADAGNKSVDVFDARDDSFLGRIRGFHGTAAPTDPCGTFDGQGPSGVLATPDNRLWVSDAHGIVKVFDLTDAEPPFNLSPIATISTGALCRADELAFDPKDHVILVGDPAETPAFITLISSDPPYNVLAQISFPNPSSPGASVWDPELSDGRFLTNVSGMGNTGFVAVIDPKRAEVETAYPTSECAPSGLALGVFQRLLIGCSNGQPLLMLDALNGMLLNVITQIHGADQVWYNSSDRRFYVASNTPPAPVLGVIDAATNRFLQAIPTGPSAHSVAAFREGNHIFVPFGPPTKTMPTDTCAIVFGFPANRGCIAVYAH